MNDLTSQKQNKVCVKIRSSLTFRSFLLVYARVIKRGNVYRLCLLLAEHLLFL